MPNAISQFLSKLRGTTGGRGMAAGMGAPLMLMVILAMIVVPLAPFVLDLLFTFNIALAIVILMAVVYVMRPLEFSAFPTVLLLVTLLRLALNVASTRVVLLHGHQGGASAGHVIEAFGNFVIGGNYAIGFIVFVILTLINFMVVTKGAERVSEVSATLRARCAARQADGDRRRFERRIVGRAKKPRRAARKSARKPISTARWTVPRSSSAVTPSPES